MWFDFFEKLYDELIDSIIKRYEETRKLATVLGENYIHRCLLDYDFSKKHYRLMAVDLSQQKYFDADLKVTQKIEFLGQLKKVR